MPERRVVGSAGGRAQHGAVSEHAAPPVSGPEPSAKRGGGAVARVVAVVAVLVAIAVVAAALLHLGPFGTAEEQAAPAEEPGRVVAVDPVSVNLADGHYLRLGFSMQMTSDAKADVDTAPAQDTAITLYAGRTVEELADSAQRESLRSQLVEELSEDYGGQVMGVYLTDFVTQ